MEFSAPRDRDAWYVIRGYKYQVDLTVLRWLTLSKSQCLHLECGEDIDIVNSAILNSRTEFDRELEQVKHLDKPITLRSPACKSALANALVHFENNRPKSLLFRFCTNTAITTERPSVFGDRKCGIDIWESLRKGLIGEPERTKRIRDILTALQRFEMPAEGVDAATWEVFSDFVRHASLANLFNLIKRFEWSTRQIAADQVGTEILRVLQNDNAFNPDEAAAIYPRLFLHVMQVLAHSGEKSLDVGSRDAMLAQRATTADAGLLKFLVSEILSQDARIEQIELATKRHEDLIANTRQRIVEMEFGAIKSLPLLAAISEIATALPPQVATIAKRQSVVLAVDQVIDAHEWVAIYGSIGCGKTQLASLIGEKRNAVVYVSMRDLNPSEANFLLHHLFLQLCGNHRSGNVTQSGLAALSPGSLLILDDVPRLVAGEPLGKRLVQIADSVRAWSQAMVTLSHYPMPSSFLATLRSGRFTELRCPTFDRNDVRDLFRQYGAPDGEVTDEVAESFAQSTSGNPTLLAALARTIEASGWNHLEAHRNQSVQSAVTGELVEQTMLRLLSTVEKQESRDLLYRLCVISGAFGANEVAAVSGVSPKLARLGETFQSLSGLWIEKQSDAVFVVCPLVARFGAKELGPEIEQAVASCLAKVILERARISPIEFSKAIGYLQKAGDGPTLGMVLLKGLQGITKLAPAWRRLMYFTTTTDGLFEKCPTSLNLLIKAKQLEIAESLEIPTTELVAEANALIERATRSELWAVLGYASQAAPIVARSDLSEGLRLCGLVIDNFDAVSEFRQEIAQGDPLSPELNDGSYLNSFPWLFVTAIRCASDFSKWLQFLSKQAPDRIQSVFASDLAREGFKLALDRLWMVQHELPNGERQFDGIFDVYAQAIEFCKSHDLQVFQALAVRAQIIVAAEYLKDLARAVNYSDEFLCEAGICEESLFLIQEATGRQYLYEKRVPEAIKALEVACELDTKTFDGLRCRAFIELSRAIGDSNHERALELAEGAVRVAMRNSREVSELDLVSALGEASIAAAFATKYAQAFEYMDKAFVLLGQRFKVTVDWKMRFVFLGNALGYMTSIASTGQPPSDDYTVPPRGLLISYNDAAAGWYDEAQYEKFDLAPTLLASFASAVGYQERAVYWATKGIDDARAKGIPACIHTLAEMLIGTSLLHNELHKALDFAFEASTAITASMVARRPEDRSVRDQQDINELLGPRSSDAWREAERHFLLIGIAPAIVYSCVHSAEPKEILSQLAAHCNERAGEASDPSSFSGVASVIELFLADEASLTLHRRGADHMKQGEMGPSIAGYLLSSFALDSDLKQSIIQHTVFMHALAGRILSKSGLWHFVTDQLVAYWSHTFEKERFRFSNPNEVQIAIQRAQQSEANERAKHLIRAIVSGLSVRIPSSIEAASNWLYK